MGGSEEELSSLRRVGFFVLMIYLCQSMIAVLDRVAHMVAVARSVGCSLLPPRLCRRFFLHVSAPPYIINYSQSWEPQLTRVLLDKMSDGEPGLDASRSPFPRVGCHNELVDCAVT